MRTFETAADLAAMFDSVSGFGELATYTPLAAPSTPVTISVILSLPDQAPSLAALRQEITIPQMQVRTSELPAPAIGDAVQIAGVTYTVKRFDDDLAGVIWTVMLSKR